MKKFSLLLSMILFAFMTTGCVKYTYNIEIDKKNNLVLSEFAAVDTSMMGGMSFFIMAEFDEPKEKYEAKGYDVVEHEVGDLKGIKATKKFKLKNMKNEDLPVGYTSANSTPVVVKEGFFKTKYSINLSYDMAKVSDDVNRVQGRKNKVSVTEPTGFSNVGSVKTEVESGDSFGNAMDDMFTGLANTNSVSMASQKSYSDNSSDVSDLLTSAELTVKIPYKAIKHNASKVINKYEYQWTFDNSPTKIELEYEKFNPLQILCTVLFFIFMFLLIRR